MPLPNLLDAIHAEHDHSACRMAATLVLAGVPLTEIETLKRGSWENLAGRIAAAREELGVTPRQPVARYYLLCEKPTVTYTPAQLRRLLLMAMEVGGPEEAGDGDHGEEARL